MSYLDEQITTRLTRDGQLRDSALEALVEAVTGERPPRVNNAGSLGDASKAIFGYLHIEMPKYYDESQELGPLAILPYRAVRLNGDWYKGGAIPLLAYSDGNAVALLPRGNGYLLVENGSKRRLRKSDISSFSEEAWAFYRPLPDSITSGGKFIRYGLTRLDASDVLKLCLTSLLMTLMGAITPWVTRTLLSGATMTAVIAALVTLLMAAFGNYVYSVLHDLLSAKIETRLGMELESALVERILRLPMTFFKVNDAGQLTQAVNSSRAIGSLMVRLLFSAGISIPMCAVYFIQIGMYTPALLLPALITMFVIWGFLIWIFQATRKTSIDRSQKTSRENTLTFTLIRGIMKLRVSGAEDRAFSLWAKQHAETSEARYRTPVMLRLGYAVPSLVTMTGTAVFYIVARNAGISAADYLAFSSAFGLIGASLSIQYNAAVSLGSIIGAARIVDPVLSEPLETTAERIHKAIRVRGGVELSHVTFRYGPELPAILDDLSVKIRPGQYVALVGASGSGKSTLLRLILGFETAATGAVYYDQYDIKKTDPRILRSCIGVVLQDDNLFSGGSIFDNLSINKPDLTETEAWEAIKLAGMEEEVRKMPMGLRTLVSERAGFSGGQKQRLLIARAIAAKPRLLILDEATSALDNITQKKVSDSLTSLKCTRIVAAHRLSTIIKCDRILMMEKGRIVEDGT